MALKGSDIRAARLAKGWTQRQLAERAAVSQAYVSMLERGRVVAPLALQTLGRVLDVTLGASASPAAPVVAQQLVRVAVTHETGTLPLRVSEWRRPDLGGDAAVMVPVGARSVLIAALDAVGHGPSVYPVAAYLLGWLRGRVGRDDRAPRLEDLAGDLLAAMRSASAEAGFFLAVVQRIGNTDAVRYEAVADRYPEPLLLVGDRPRPEPAAGTVDRRHADAVVQPLTTTLVGTWRLVIASDGLLSRLGAGNEATGQRELRSWQAGLSRDQPLVDRLETAEPPTDDESALLVVFEPWQDEVLLTAGDVEAERRLLRTLRAAADPRVGSERTAALVQAALEGLGNASRHAYADDPGGPVRVRWRGGEGAFTVEVHDAGCGIRAADASRDGGGLAVARRLCAWAEARRNAEGGTTLTLVATAPEPERGGRHGH